MKPSSREASPTHSSTASATVKRSAPRSTTAKRTAAPPAAKAARPVIALDAGHSRSVSAIDPATGLEVSEYENEPEMRDVFSVATAVKAKLLRDGYRVVMTKPTLDTKRNLAQRAAIANQAHAALAVSIHDQAGSNGGIGFRAGNNIVYYQAVGKYRSTSSGKKIVFTDANLAAVSKKCAAIIQSERAKAQGTSVRIQDDIGYDMASRGKAAGNMWVVQLLGRVPWVYSEAGGNSSGQVGLSVADAQTYARGLVAGIERCVPVG